MKGLDETWPKIGAEWDDRRRREGLRKLKEERDVGVYNAGRGGALNHRPLEGPT